MRKWRGGGIDLETMTLAQVQARLQEREKWLREELGACVALASKLSELTMTVSQPSEGKDGAQAGRHPWTEWATDVLREKGRRMHARDIAAAIAEARGCKVDYRKVGFALFKAARRGHFEFYGKNTFGLRLAKS